MADFILGRLLGSSLSCPTHRSPSGSRIEEYSLALYVGDEGLGRGHLGREFHLPGDRAHFVEMSKKILAQLDPAQDQILEKLDRIEKLLEKRLPSS